MSGQNQRYTRSGRFDNLDCPVEVGEPCVMPFGPEPDEDKPRSWVSWQINPAYLVALAGIIVSLLIWGGGPNGVNTQLANHAIIVKQQDREIAHLDEKIKENDTRVDKRLESMERKMDALSQKMDKIVERGR